MPDQDVSIVSDDSTVESFFHLRSTHLLNGPNKTYNRPLPITKHLDISRVRPKKRTKLGFDQIYVINLERREDRKSRIQSTLDDLNLSYRIFKAVDGKKIDDEYIKSLGIKPLPLYKDPYNDRPLNFGEIGCFLSHYFIWKDVRFSNYFYIHYLVYNRLVILRSRLLKKAIKK